MNHSTNFWCLDTAKQSIYTLSVLVMLSTSGCMNSLDGSTGPVIWGQITHNGKPVSGGFVVYYPEVSELVAMEGTAILSHDGTYRILNSDRGFPLLTGWYKISVQPSRVMHQVEVESPRGTSRKGDGESKEPATAEKTDSGDSKPISANVDAQPGSEFISKNDIPMVYQDPKTSNLKLWVRAQPMRVDINLRD